MPASGSLRSVQPVSAAHTPAGAAPVPPPGAADGMSALADALDALGAAVASADLEAMAACAPRLDAQVTEALCLLRTAANAIPDVLELAGTMSDGVTAFGRKIKETRAVAINARIAAGAVDSADAGLTAFIDDVAEVLEHSERGFARTKRIRKQLFATAGKLRAEGNALSLATEAIAGAYLAGAGPAVEAVRGRVAAVRAAVEPVGRRAAALAKHDRPGAAGGGGPDGPARDVLLAEVERVLGEDRAPAATADRHDGLRRGVMALDEAKYSINVDAMILLAEVRSLLVDFAGTGRRMRMIGMNAVIACHKLSESGRALQTISRELSRLGAEAMETHRAMEADLASLLGRWQSLSAPLEEGAAKVDAAVTALQIGVFAAMDEIDGLIAAREDDIRQRVAAARAR